MSPQGGPRTRTLGAHVTPPRLVPLGSRGPRGFTLTELMVALAGGLIVAVLAFTLAKDSTRFYQRQAHLADTMLNAVAGFQRLTSDLARTGYMASANIAQDPGVCRSPSGDPWSSYPMLKDLSALRVSATDGAAAYAAQVGAAYGLQGTTIDTVILAGNYTTVDQFPTFGVSNDTGGYRVELQATDEALVRNGGADLANLQRLFPVGSAVRLVDAAGRTQYGVVSGHQLDTSGGRPALLLSNDPPLRLATGSGTRDCALQGYTGITVNPVNFVRYQLRDMSADSRFASLFPDATNTDLAVLERDRLELVREELLPDGTVASTEIVAQYAVDLNIGVTGIGAAGTAVYAETDADLGAFTDDVSASATTRPQAIRTVRARLSVRSKTPEPGGPLPAGVGVPPGLFRWCTRNQPDNEDDLSVTCTAVRTLRADVGLPNLEELTW